MGNSVFSLKGITKKKKSEKKKSEAKVVVPDFFYLLHTVVGASIRRYCKWP